MVLGITGCPGSGKSQLAAMLTEYGWTLVNADRIGRELVENDMAILHELAASFGGDILDDSAALNRRLLASRAFSTAESTQRLNEIVHPRLIGRLIDIVNNVKCGNDDIIVDCALIFEWNIQNIFDVTICVSADIDIRIHRLSERDGRSAAEIEDMFAAQLSQETKMSRADITINNNGSLERLRLFGLMLSKLSGVSCTD